jgi:hypothetical protein
MKKFLLSLSIVILYSSIEVFAQTNLFPQTGNVGIGTISPTYKLDILGSSKITDGFLNSDNYFEKVFPDIAFTNGVANLAVDLRLGNVHLWGYVEVEITSTYNHQNSVGKLTKIYAVGANPGGNIFTNEARVSDVIGTIGNNISFGELSWDNTNSTYKIPISHIVSTGNVYTIKVKMFTNGSWAKGVFDGITTGPVYTLTSLPKNFVSFNDNVGIGTTTPTEKLEVNGNVQLSGTIKYGNAGVRTEYRSNAGLQGNAGALSGFYETSSPLNFPKDDSNWWHLIDSRHSNTDNNFAMQIAGSFFDQKLYFRKTNNNPAEAWKEFVAVDASGRINLDNDVAGLKKPVTIGSYVYGGAIRFNANSAVANNRNLELGNWDNNGVFYPRMAVSSENGNVGIGTTIPEINSILHINGGHGNTGTLLQLPSSANANNTGDIFLKTWVSEPLISWEGTGIGANINNVGLKRFNNSMSSAYIRFVPNPTSGFILFSTIAGNGAKHDNVMAIVDDKVGIGTTTPSGKFEISSANGSAKFKIGDAAGNSINHLSWNTGAAINIPDQGGANPLIYFRKTDYNNLNNFTDVFQVKSDGSVQATGQVRGNDFVTTGTNSWIFHTPDDGRKTMFISPGLGTSDGSAGWDWYKGIILNNDGSMGIGLSAGTQPANYKLAVGGDVIAERVVVKLQANWPDYVFKTGYSLRPLSEVEAFVKTNNHLPDVPSEAEIKEKGIDVEQMNATLLKKVEELTLYLIEQQKEVKTLREEVRQLKEKK